LEDYKGVLRQQLWQLLLHQVLLQQQRLKLHKKARQGPQVAAP
jgi:malate synthase